MAGVKIRMNPLGGMVSPMPKAAGAMPKLPSMGAPMHVASTVGASGMHSYLGHFSTPGILRAGHNSGGHWIAGAIKHPGVEKRAAAKAGESTHAYMEQHKGDSGTAGKRARLGLTLSRMSKGRK
jgi:hypothetical protein